MGRLLTAWSAALAVATSLATMIVTGGCTVHQAEQVPALSGPSGLAQSMSVTATPDSLTQDGHSQAAIAVSVIGPNGQPLVGVPVRLDIFADGVLVDFGTLSARTIVTGTDGRATAVYTAPPTPPSAGNSSTSMVTIRAVALGTNAQASTAFSAGIRLMPPGVILPPAGTPTAAFTVSPTSGVSGVPLNFDASSSVPGSAAGAILSYVWSFGDGTTGSGVRTTHAFPSANTYNVTLTVTSDRGLSASVTQPVSVVAPAPPSAVFNVSPGAPRVGDTVFFNAAAASAAPGRTLAAYQWAFGDGTTGSGAFTSHQYSAPGTYVVTLTVTDDLGQNASATQTVAVAGALGSGPPVSGSSNGRARSR